MDLPKIATLCVLCSSSLTSLNNKSFLLWRVSLNLVQLILKIEYSWKVILAEIAKSMPFTSRHVLIWRHSGFYCHLWEIIVQFCSASFVPGMPCLLSLTNCPLASLDTSLSWLLSLSNKQWERLPWYLHSERLVTPSSCLLGRQLR